APVPASRRSRGPAPGARWGRTATPSRESPRSTPLPAGMPRDESPRPTWGRRNGRAPEATRAPPAQPPRRDASSYRGGLPQRAPQRLDLRALRGLGADADPDRRAPAQHAGGEVGPARVVDPGCDREIARVDPLLAALAG